MAMPGARNHDGERNPAWAAQLRVIDPINRFIDPIDLVNRPTSTASATPCGPRSCERSTQSTHFIDPIDHFDCERNPAWAAQIRAIDPIDPLRQRAQFVSEIA
jgi:hypothetical protein